MKEIKVKDLMVPLKEYATVFQEADLCEAILALEEAQQEFDRSHYLHRAILVYDEKRKIVGKISQLDVIRGLEPKYEQILDLKTLRRFGYSANQLDQMMKGYQLWQRPLENICRESAQRKVKEIMYVPSEQECVSEDATLDEAIHQLIMGAHQSLLVLRGEYVVGVLRLTDVFKEICNRVKACKI
ncbi:MAG: CBS domain-containing protein [Deltaproteobacteria bacterium]|nr:CBS domain-containing protein [Deltaproteobacteria bacterium]